MCSAEPVHRLLHACNNTEPDTHDTHNPVEMPQATEGSIDLAALAINNNTQVLDTLPPPATAPVPAVCVLDQAAVRSKCQLLHDRTRSLLLEVTPAALMQTAQPDNCKKHPHSNKVAHV